MKNLFFTLLIFLSTLSFAQLNVSGGTGVSFPIQTAPSGTGCAAGSVEYSFLGSTGYGMSMGSGATAICANGTGYWFLNANAPIGVSTGSDKIVGWGATADATSGGVDTAISRNAANDIEVGMTGSTRDGSGTIKATQIGTKTNTAFIIGVNNNTSQWNFKTTGNFQLQQTSAHLETVTTGHDISGTIALSAATSASFTFGQAYIAAAPSCILTPTSNLGATTYWVTTSTTTITANVSVASTVTFNYFCFGNPS